MPRQRKIQTLECMQRDALAAFFTACEVLENALALKQECELSVALLQTNSDEDPMLSVQSRYRADRINHYLKRTQEQQQRRLDILHETTRNLRKRKAEYEEQKRICALLNIPERYWDGAEIKRKNDGYTHVYYRDRDFPLLAHAHYILDETESLVYKKELGHPLGNHIYL